MKSNSQPNNERNEKILQLYKDGKTFEEIGKIYNFSRSRAQQIIAQQIRKNIIEKFNFYDIVGEELALLDVAVREEIQDIYIKRRKTSKESKRNELEQRIKLKMSSLPDYRNFNTLSSYVRALGEDINEFKLYFPKIAQNIVENRKKKWSWYYNQCRSCGTTSINHASHGLCKKCYLKSDYFKEINEASRLRNKEKWKEKQREYHKKYSQRPEIKEKHRKQNDLLRYGGNREKAIEKDHYKCRFCGITRNESREKYNRDLYVIHLNGKKDNLLDNLVTLCEKCHNKRMMAIMRARLKAKN